MAPAPPSLPLSFPKRSSSGVALGLVGLVALGAGVFQGNAGLIALAVIFITGPALAYWQLRRQAKALRLSRATPRSAFESEGVEVFVEITNDSSRALFYPEVIDVFTPEIHSQKSLLFAGRVLPGEKIRQSYRGYCLLPRGIYEVGPTAVRITDPWGWFEIKKLFALRTPIKIYPKVHRLSIHERVGSTIDSFAAELTQRVRGESQEFLTVREYRTGDSPRRIHWPLTAHRGFPVVREFHRVASGDLCIFLDLHPHSLIGLGRGSSTEHAVKIAASASAHALRRGRQVQLFAGSQPAHAVRPERGSASLPRILEVLTRVRPSEDELALPELVTHYASRVPRGGTIVVMMSPYAFTDPVLRGQLLAWRQHGHRVVAVLFDASTFYNLRDFISNDVGAVRRCADELRGAGIEPIVVPCAAELERVFMEAQA